MADNINLEDVKDSIKEVGETLLSFKADSIAQSQNTEKAILAVNTSLETLSENEENELIKVFLEELQKTLGERHQFVADKFKKIERSFKSLTERADEALKAEDIKDIFDNIASNFNVFSKNVANQKDILTEIDTKIAEIKNDDSKKRDIMRSIAVMKSEVEKFNNGFESLIVNINTNFQNMTEAFNKIDATEAFSTLKKDIENIYLASNSILSTLQVIDKKNRDLDKAVENMVSISDFESHKKQVAELIAQNIQLTEYIHGLADKTGMESLNQKVDVAVGVINALKNVLSEKSTQNQQMLSVQLEKLSTAASEIVSEEDFSKFRAELLRVVEGGIQSSNLVRAELLDTNAELKNLFNFLNSFEIKSNFEQMSNVVKTSEENVKESVREISEKISQTSEQYKTLITTDINNNVSAVSDKIEGIEGRMRDYTKDSADRVIEDINSVISEINTVKDSIHVENMESMENFEDKFEEIKANINISKENFNKISKTNFENLVANMAAIVQKIDIINADLSQNSKDTLKNTVISLEKMSKEIENFNQSFNANSHQNKDEIIASFSNIYPKFDEIKENLSQIANGIREEYNNQFNRISGEIGTVKNDLGNLAHNEAENIVSKLSEMHSNLESTVSNCLNDANSVQANSLNASIEEMANRIEVMKENINKNSQESFSSVLSVVEKFSTEVSALKEFISQNSTENSEILSSKLNSISLISESLSGIKSELVQNSSSNCDKIVSTMREISEGLENLVNNKFDASDLLQSENYKKAIEDFSNKLSWLKNAISEDNSVISKDLQSSLKEFAGNFENIKSDIEATSNYQKESIENFANRLSQELNNVRESMEKNSKLLFETTMPNFDKVASKLQECFKSELDQSATLQNGALDVRFAEVNDRISWIKNNSDEARSKNFEGLKAEIDNIAVILEPMKNELKGKAQENFNNLISSLNEISAQTEVFINENFSKQLAQREEKVNELKDFVSDKIKEINENLNTQISIYTEENSQNSQTLNEKIQNLTEGIMSKDAAFKSEVLTQISEVKKVLASTVDDFSDTNSTFTEKLNASFTNIENIVNNKQEEFNNSLEDLQVKLIEYLKDVQNKLEDEGYKFDDISGKCETIETMTDILLKDTEGIKTQISDKSSEITGNLVALEDAINAVSSFDFSNIAIDVKSYVRNINDELAQKLDSATESTTVQVLNKLNETFKNLESKIDEFSTQANINNENSNGKFNKIDENFLSIESLVISEGNKNFDVIKSLVQSIIDKIEESKTHYLDVKESQNETKREIIDAINLSKEEFLAKQSEINAQIDDNISGFSNSATLNKEEIIAKQDETAENLSQKISDFSNSAKLNKEEILAKQDEIKSSLEETLGTISSQTISAKSEFSEKSSELKEELTGKLEEIKTTFSDTTSNQTDVIKEDLSSLLMDISKIQDTISSYKVDIADLLKVSDEEFKSKLASIEDTIANEVSSNLENFRDTIRTSAEEIQGKISVSEENYKTSTESLVNNIKSGFEEKVDDSLDDLKSFLEVVEEKREFNKVIDDAKNEIFEKFEEISTNFEDSVKNISHDEDFEKLNEDLKTSVNELLEDFYGKFVTSLDENKALNDTFTNTEEIIRRADDLKKTVSEDIDEKLETFNINLEKQKEDFSNLISEIKVSIGDLKEAYTDLSVNSSMELSQLLTGIDEKISGLKTDTEGLEFKDIIENANTELKEGFTSSLNNVLDEKLSGVKEEIEGISQKLDVFVSTEDTDAPNIEEQVNEIKTNIQTQGQLLENLKVLTNLDSLSKLDGLENIQNDVKDILNKFDDKLTPFKEIEPEDEQDASDIKLELDKMKGELIESILSVFDQISFVVEAEDIKDFVENKAEDIKGFVTEQIKSVNENLENSAKVEEIKTALGTNFEDILSNLDTLQEKAENSTTDLSEIKQDIQTVKNHLEAMQNSEENAKEGDDDNGEYTYTLSDVETDIAKIRLILNEIAEAQNKEEKVPVPDTYSALENLSNLDKLDNLDKINEDIVSLSTRTNKILLNSDESYNALKSNLDDFKQIATVIDQKVRYMDTTDINKRIENKIERVNNLVQSSIKSDKIFNQALMYLAEWVDTASENINSITERVEKVSELDEVKFAIKELKTSMPKNGSEKLLDEISKRFESQQTHIKKLEEKIEMLSSKKEKTTKLTQTDVKIIVDAVLSKLEKSEAKNTKNTTLTKKVDNIEKQLSQLTEGIQKLTSYVDE